MRTARRASLVIRNLDPSSEEGLRVRAAGNGHSMEAEARVILETAPSSPEGSSAPHLHDRVRARFARLGGVDLDLPPREPAREPPRSTEADAGLTEAALTMFADDI